jgi:ATP-binding cassette subfamily B protein
VTVPNFGTIARRGGGWLPLIGMSALAGTLSALALPSVLGHAVDEIVTGGPSVRWFALATALILVGIAADLIDSFAGTACVAGTTAWLRNRLIRHVLAIGPARARDFDTGDLVSRVCGNSVDAAHAGPSVVTAWTAALPPLGSLVLLVLIDPWLAVAFLAGVFVVFLVLRVFTRRTAEVVADYQGTQGRIAARLAESLAGVRTIAAAGTLDREERRVLAELPDLHEQGMRSWRVLSGSMAQAAVAGPLVLVAVLATGGLSLIAGRISAGELFAASQYAVLGAGLGGLTDVFGRLARARAGVRRTTEVLDTPTVHYGQKGLRKATGRLEFRGVTVRDADATLVDHVDLVIPGGTTVAVVGQAGAGKSLLAALAARLRDPDEGTVLLDGVPLSELGHDPLRRAVGCAFERPVLVGATVGDAIGMGLDHDRVRSAAEATYAHDFVTRFPDGYRTPLADAPMSGGEAQRLGLARAWRAERLLVLDDATSSVDMVTEMRIGRTLTEGHAGRTRLIVTHRVATAARADVVVWLADGRVRATGPHERLWDDPAYRGVFG